MRPQQMQLTYTEGQSKVHRLVPKRDRPENLGVILTTYGYNFAQGKPLVHK